MDSEWHGRDLPEFMPLGDVRGFDVRTGELVWTFSTVPQESEFGNETWENDSWKHFGGANAWAPMSADTELGYAYLPLSAPTHDYYGGERPGDNLFSGSLVCVECSTGKRVWHYQLIHHDIWDYDTASAPILVDIEVDGTPVKAVVQIAKQGFAYVFDRLTGEPVWPIDERPVPPSAIEGEQASPTQPFPTKPAPFDRQGFTEDDLIDFTPELRAEALEMASEFDFGPLYTPPTAAGVWVLPGGFGGADWGGGAADPRGWIYIPSKTVPSILGLRKSEGDSSFSRYTADFRFPRGPQQLPFVKPPYGRITAIDMNTGEHRWMVPVGRGPLDHPALRDLDLPPLGWDTRAFAMATPGMLVVAPGPPGMLRGFDREFYIDPEASLVALDLDDGHEIARVDLPRNASGNPIAYTADGRDFIAVATGAEWGSNPAVVALAIPRPGEVLPPQGYDRSDADHAAYYDAVEAFDAGDAKALRRLLDAHPDLVGAAGYLDSAYVHGWFRGASLLHLVAGHPQREKLPDNVLDLSQMLLDAGADPNATTLDSTPTLQLVLDGEQPRWSGVGDRLVAQLLEAGADANHDNGFFLWQTMMSGDRLGERGRLLVQHGARVDLRMAAGMNDVELMRTFFTAEGALTPSAAAAYRYARPDSLGPLSHQEILNEALSFAAINDARDAAALLLDRGAEINSMPPHFHWPEDYGWTALHKTIDYCKPDMARFLLERGANPDLKERRWDSSARRWASRWGCDDVRRVFESFDPEVGSK